MVKLKAGDKVRFTDADDWIDFDAYSVYEIKSDQNGDLYVIDDVGDWRSEILSYGEVELVTEVPTSSPFVREVVTREYGGEFSDEKYPTITVSIDGIGYTGDVVISQDDGSDNGVFDEIWIKRDRLKEFAKALLELAEALDSE